MKKLFILSILASLFVVGCSSKSGAPKAPDVKAADAVAVKIIRLDRDLAKSNVNNLTAVGPMIRAKYGEFGELYCEGILGIGRTTSPDFQKGLYAFLTYPVVQEGFSASNRVFTPDVISKVEEEMEEAERMAFEKSLNNNLDNQILIEQMKRDWELMGQYKNNKEVNRWQQMEEV